MKKIPLILFICSFFFLFYAFKLHPYHVGSVEFNYNQKSKTFQITGKFFLDDLETALNKKYATNLHFNEEKFKTELNSNIKKYCEENLKLKSDNKLLKIKYIGYEEDKESVNVFLESESAKIPKKVETSVSFLYNYFDDQMNIIHIIVGGNRKSEKLTFPDRYLYQNF